MGRLKQVWEDDWDGSNKCGKVNGMEKQAWQIEWDGSNKCGKVNGTAQTSVTK
jgi:hypothetical protein